MTSELVANGSPGKWRYTWEAQSHIPTLRLLLFNSTINPKYHCTDLKFDLNLEQSFLHVSGLEQSKEVAVELSIRVPLPRVLLDVDCPLSFKVMDDHIEVKLLLLLPVDHPIVLNCDNEEKEQRNASETLGMDSDLDLLSSKKGVHFYCRNCSAKLTKLPIRNFVEMASADWREVADNWFGSCCCSFGGISEKLVTKYANSHSFFEGTCLLSMMFIVLCKDDLVGCKIPDLDGYQKYEHKNESFCDDDFETKHQKTLCCEDHCKKENFPANQTHDGESLVSHIQSLNISDYDNCSHDVCKTSVIDQDPMKLMENQKPFLNGFLGNLFMVRSSHLSKDIDWVNFECPNCLTVLGAYPCKNGYRPVDGGVRLLKCYISTSVPVCSSDNTFRKYTLERMFTNQLLENANEEISFRTMVRDMKTKSPALQIILLNPHSWYCSGLCSGAEDTKEPISKIDLLPVLKLLFSNCSNNTESQLRDIEEWVIKNEAEEAYMLDQQIKDLIKSLESAQDAFPPSCAFFQGLPLSFLQR